MNLLQWGKIEDIYYRFKFMKFDTIYKNQLDFKLRNKDAIVVYFAKDI